MIRTFMKEELWEIDGEDILKELNMPAIVKVIEIGNDFGYLVVLSANKHLTNLPCKFKHGIIKNGLKEVQGFKIKLVTFQELINGSDLVHQD